MKRVGEKLIHYKSTFSSENLLVKRSMSDISQRTLKETIIKGNAWVGHARHQNVHGRQVWYIHNNNLHHAYELHEKVPSNYESYVSIIDSGDGQVLATYPRKMNEQGLVYPGNFPAFGSRPPSVELLNVLSNVSPFSIRGKDVHSGNTCFAYKCVDGSVQGNCTINSSVCVDRNSSMVGNVDFFTKSVVFTVDGRNLDYDYDWQQFGYVNNTVYLQWDDASVGTSRLGNPNFNSNDSGKIWGEGIDFSKLTGGEQTDSFAELQTYQLFEKHAEFFRALLNDSSFCFVGSGPNCTTTNGTNGVGSGPMKFFVNYQQLKVDYGTIMSQVKSGRGKSPSEAVTFSEHAPYEDAFFSRGPLTDDGVECGEGGCLSILDYPFTHFAFGQNERFDWSANPCTVYHELGHALVAKFIPQLPGYTWAESGLRSDPGAMNEGWSDYFAAINCGISDFRKTYNGRPRRNLENENTCGDTVGQLHQDSLIFSGGLWEVRKLIVGKFGLGEAGQTDFDRVVLKALTMGQISDLFETQFKSILNILATHPTLSIIKPDAEMIFNKRELKCERVKDLTEGMDPTFILPHPALSMANFSTIPAQLRIKPRASDWGILLQWKQFTNNPWLGPLDKGYGSAPLKYMASSCPIKFIGQVAGNITGVSDCSSVQETLSWVQTRISKDNGGSIYLAGIPPSQDIYIVLGSDVPASMVLFSSSLELKGFNNIWVITFAVIGSGSFVGFILSLIWSKTQLKLKNDRRAWWILAGGNFTSALAGAFAACALTFGIIRLPFSITAFVLHMCAMVMIYSFYECSPRYLGIIYMRLLIQILFGINIVATIVGLGVYLSSSVGIAGHTIVYTVFVLSKLAIDGLVLYLCLKSVSRRLRNK